MMMRMSHYICVVLVLIATTNANPIENPCQSIDKITFPGDPTLRSVEWNNKTILCLADGTIAMNPSDSPTNANNVDTPPRFEFPTHRPMVPPKSPASSGVDRFQTNSKDYPLDVINQLLEKEGDDVNLMFSTDAIETDVSTRNGNDDDDLEMCVTTTEVVYPDKGLTQNETWLFIINTDQHKQGVRISRCGGLNEPCRFANNFPNGFVSTCKQQYIYRELWALSADLKSKVRERFQFPACCSCHLSKKWT